MDTRRHRAGTQGTEAEKRKSPPRRSWRYRREAPRRHLAPGSRALPDHHSQGARPPQKRSGPANSRTQTIARGEGCQSPRREPDDEPKLVPDRMPFSSPNSKFEFQHGIGAWESPRNTRPGVRAAWQPNRLITSYPHTCSLRQPRDALFRVGEARASRSRRVGSIWSLVRCLRRIGRSLPNHWRRLVARGRGLRGFRAQRARRTRARQRIGR